MDEDVKKCCTCGIEYPKTLEYFFRKKIKENRADGRAALYLSFRSDCKKCHGEKGKQRHRKNRYSELGCSEENYKESWIRQMSINKYKYKELSFLPRSVRHRIYNKIKNGYSFTTIEQYKLDCRINAGKPKRKYFYKNKGLLSMAEKNKKYADILTDAHVANRNGFRVSDLPKPIIQTQRLIIKLNRELNK